MQMFAGVAPDPGVVYNLVPQIARRPVRRVQLAALAVLIGGVAPAHADRRPVAVIDLSGEPTAERLAHELGQVLNDHPELQPIDNPALAGELMGRFDDDDANRLQRALGSRQVAEQQLAEFRFELAAQTAQNAQDDLLLVMPTSTAIQTYAELAFALGQARLGERRPQDAADAFLLAHRLAPSFSPDPARYLPEVIHVYRAAKTRPTTLVPLTVTGAGRVWIDGKERGAAPVKVEIPAGTHVVWLTGVDRETRGKKVVLLPSKPQTIAIEDAPASSRLRVRRARARLKLSPDPTARASAMKHLAQLLAVHDAILLGVTNGTPSAQIWRDRAPWFSARREVKGELPGELLTPLVPMHQAAVPTGPEITFADDRRWYQRRRVQLGTAAGVIAAVVGSILIYRARELWEAPIKDAGFPE